MTKKEIDDLIVAIRKEQIDDYRSYLGWQHDEFREGYYEAIRNVELQLEDMKEELNEQP